MPRRPLSKIGSCFSSKTGASVERNVVAGLIAVPQTDSLARPTVTSQFGWGIYTSSFGALPAFAGSSTKSPLLMSSATSIRSPGCTTSPRAGIERGVSPTYSYLGMSISWSAGVGDRQRALDADDEDERHVGVAAPVHLEEVPLGAPRGRHAHGVEQLHVAVEGGRHGVPELDEARHLGGEVVVADENPDV